MSTLHGIIWSQTTEVLQFRLKLLGKKPAGTRKPELIDAVKADLTALLHLAEKGELSVSAKTGIPSAAASEKILACLTGGDFYPPEVAFSPKEWGHEQQIGLIKPVAWARLLQHAKLVTCGGP